MTTRCYLLGVCLHPSLAPLFVGLAAAHSVGLETPRECMQRNLSDCLRVAVRWAADDARGPRAAGREVGSDALGPSASASTSCSSSSLDLDGVWSLIAELYERPLEGGDIQRAGASRGGVPRTRRPTVASLSPCSNSSACPLDAPLAEKFDRIKTELNLDPSLRVLVVVQKAQEMLGIQPKGTLIQKVDALLRELVIPDLPRPPAAPAAAVASSSSSSSSTTSLPPPAGAAAVPRGFSDADNWQLLLWAALLCAQDWHRAQTTGSAEAASRYQETTCPTLPLGLTPDPDPNPNPNPEPGPNPNPNPNFNPYPNP